MKRAFFVLALAFVGNAYAALLTSEVIQGLNKICIYSDGSTITISSAGVCRLSK